jgi:hypothetical protein
MRGCRRNITFTVSDAVIFPVVVGQDVLAFAVWTFCHALYRAKGKTMRKMSASMVMKGGRLKEDGGSYSRGALSASLNFLGHRDENCDEFVGFLAERLD